MLALPTKTWAVFLILAVGIAIVGGSAAAVVPLLLDPVLEAAADGRDYAEVQWLWVEEPLTTLVGIEAFTNLEGLRLTLAADISLAPLQNLKRLRSLTIDGAPSLYTVRGLEHMEQLRILRLRDLGLNDIGFLHGLPSLEILEVPGNEISDLAAIASLPYITELNLADNAVSDLNPLRPLQQLRQLNLSGNPLFDLTSLSELAALEVLDLRFTPNADLKPLQHLSLQRLYVLESQHAPLAISAAVAAAAVVVPVREEKIGDYRVRIGGGDGHSSGFLEIVQGDQRVYYREGYRFVFFQEKPVDWDDAPQLALGKDITGSGWPNLVVEHWSGGAHCCFSYYIFSLGPTLQVLDMLDLGHSSAYFSDRSGDGRWEVLAYDTTYAYWKTAFALSPAPRVVLRFDGSGYVLCRQSMRTAAPSAADIAAAAAAINAGAAALEGSENFTDKVFWGPLLDWIYGGHASLAAEVLAASWPENLPGRERFAAELAAVIVRSPWYEDLLVLNRVR